MASKEAKSHKRCPWSVSRASCPQDQACHPHWTCGASHQVTPASKSISSPVTLLSTRGKPNSCCLKISLFTSVPPPVSPQARGPLPWFRALFEPHLASASLTRVMWGGLQPHPISHFLGFFVSPASHLPDKMSLLNSKWKFQRLP